MLFSRLFCSLVLLCVVTAATQAQRPLPVYYGDDTTVHFEVATGLHNGILYASLNDLAGALHLATHAMESPRKLEVRLGMNTLRVTAQNPFVVITDRDITTNVVQLPFPVLADARTFRVPLDSFLPLFDRVVEQELFFDPTAWTLTIGGSPPEATPDTGMTEIFEGPPAEHHADAGSAGDRNNAPPVDDDSIDNVEDDLEDRSEPLNEPPVTAPPLRTSGKGPASSSFDITGVSFESKTNGDLIRIHATKPLKDYSRWLKTEGTVTWLYVTIAGAKTDAGAIRSTPPSGMVRGALVFESPGSVQLTFKLKGDIRSTEIFTEQGSNDLLVTLHAPLPDSSVAIGTAGDLLLALDKERNRWKLDCIVIDAGHGGHDPGTIGLTQTREKDVTLSIALRLGKLLEEKMPEVKVVYTRKTDTFVELYKRGQIANAAGGKLFISIHCNAAPRKPHPTKGFEIYLLRPGKTDHALRIAERENAVVALEQGYEQNYERLTEEHFILLTMAQSAYIQYSEQFAHLLQKEMGDHLEIENHGVKQAGFYVLVGASMPNALIETGYLSNKQDEKVLRSKNGQQRIAEAIYNGVARYKEEYERSLEEGKVSKKDE